MSLALISEADDDDLLRALETTPGQCHTLTLLYFALMSFTTASAVRESGVDVVFAALARTDERVLEAACNLIRSSLKEVTLDELVSRYQVRPLSCTAFRQVHRSFLSFCQTQLELGLVHPSVHVRKLCLKLVFNPAVAADELASTIV